MSPPEVDRLVAEVEERFLVTGADTPGWPDPWPDRQPDDDAYSRCLDPAKHLILRARLQAWTDVLVARGAARVDDDVVLADVPRTVAGAQPERARWLRPERAGPLPLLLCFRSLDGVPDAIVDLGVGDPPVPAGDQVGCECDACDSGSQDLLDLVDGAVLDVVTGRFVHLELPDGGTLVTTRGGWSSSGTVPGEEATARGDFPEVLDEAATSTLATSATATYVLDDEPDPRARADAARELEARLARQPAALAIAAAREGRSPHPAVVGAPWW